MNIISQLSTVVIGVDGTRYYLMSEIQQVVGTSHDVSRYFTSQEYLFELRKVRYTNFDTYLNLLTPVIYIDYCPHIREELVENFVEWLEKQGQ